MEFPARCGRVFRSYLAMGDSPKLINDEYAVRSRADLPSHLLDYAGLLQRFTVGRAAAILSSDAADADPACD